MEDVDKGTDYSVRFTFVVKDNLTWELFVSTSDKWEFISHLRKMINDLEFK